MKKLYYLVLMLGLSGSGLNAQSVSFEWAKGLGSSETDAATSICVDHEGNIISIGTFKGTVDFNSGTGVNNLTSLGEDDIYILKTDAEGEFIWAVRMGGTQADYGLAITVDASGNIYSTGYFQHTVDFDPGSGSHDLTSNGGTDIYIQKLNSDGEFVWAKSVGGVAALDIGYNIKVDNSGNVYTTGAFGNVVDFNPGTGIYSLISLGGYDIFIQKLDDSGEFVWAKRMGEASNFDIGYALDLDTDGNIYTAGIYRNTVDFDPGTGTYDLTSLGGNDIFVQKLNTNGDFEWAKSIGGIGISDVLYALTLDDDNNIYATGGFSGIVDFDSGDSTYNLTSAGEDDMFVLKMDNAGDFVWATQMGGSLSDLGRSIAVDDIGSVYTTGYFRDQFTVSTHHGNETLTAEGGDDIFIQKQDAVGNIIWIKQIGSENHDRGLGLVLDNSDNIYTTGYYSDTTDFDTESGTLNLMSGGGYDQFVHKLSQCYSSSTDQQISCDPFVWLDGNIYAESTNHVILITPDANGCDSIIRLDLTILQIATSFSVSPTTITAHQAGGATYRWLDCDDNYAVIPGETDQTYTPVSNGNYAVEITIAGCSDTTECFNFNTVGLEDELFNQVSIYPNPTQGQVTIQTGDLEDVVLNVYDVLGKRVQNSINISEASTQIELTGDAGVYFVELSVNQIKQRYRVIKH